MANEMDFNQNNSNKAPKPEFEFESIKIGLASPEKNPV